MMRVDLDFCLKFHALCVFKFFQFLKTKKCSYLFSKQSKISPNHVLLFCHRSLCHLRSILLQYHRRSLRLLRSWQLGIGSKSHWILQHRYRIHRIHRSFSFWFQIILLRCRCRHSPLLRLFGFRLPESTSCSSLVHRHPRCNSPHHRRWSWSNSLHQRFFSPKCPN